MQEKSQERSEVGLLPVTASLLVSYCVDTFDNIGKKLFRPYFQNSLVSHKGADLLAGLLDIEGGNSLLLHQHELFMAKFHLAAPVSGLSHTLLEMLQVEPGMVAAIPDEVVPVSSLDTISPLPAEDSMHFVGIWPIASCMG